MILVDLQDLRFDEGAHLLVKRALGSVDPGEEIQLRGQARDLELHLQVWCRAAGHQVRSESGANGYRIARGHADTGRWQGAEQAGGGDPLQPGNVVERPPRRWGLAARGATVEEEHPTSALPWPPSTTYGPTRQFACTPAP